MSIKPDKWIRRMSAEKLYNIVLLGQAAELATANKRPLIHQHSFEELEQQFGGDEANRPFLETLRNMQVGDELTLVDQDLKVGAVKNDRPLISPFVGSVVREAIVPEFDPNVPVKIPSYGLSSYGYDIRLGQKALLDFGVSEADVVDVLKPESKKSWSETDGSFELMPGQMALGVSMERIIVPADVTVVCMPKSTLARIGLEASITPLEAGWEGFVTLEIFNKSRNTIRLHPGIGIMQLLFLQGMPCETTYAQRGGKYMDQPALPVTAQN